MNDEWNNENTALSVVGVAVAVLAIVAVIVFVIASLAAPAHAQQVSPVQIPAPESPPASPLPAEDGGTAAVVLTEARADGDSASVNIAIGIFVLVALGGIVVYSIVNYSRRGK